MAHADIDLGMMPKFYNEMTFSSYYETRHRNENGQRVVYISVSGVHVDCGFVTIVQHLRQACVISEQRVPPEYASGCDVRRTEGYEPDDSVGARLHERRKAAFGDGRVWLMALKAHGEAAFEVALTKATKAGVIRPTIVTKYWDREPRVLTRAESKVAMEGGYEALVAYWNSMPQVE